MEISRINDKKGLKCMFCANDSTHNLRVEVFGFLGLIHYCAKKRLSRGFRETVSDLGVKLVEVEEHIPPLLTAGPLLPNQWISQHLSLYRF